MHGSSSVVKKLRGLRSLPAGRRPALAAGALCVAMAVSSAPAAAATASQARARCLPALAKALHQLRKLTKQVRNDTQVPRADRVSLNGRITHATIGIIALRARLGRDGTAAAVDRDCRLADTTYRVRPVLTTQVRIVLAADLTSSSAQSLLTLASVFQRRIDAARDRGRNVAAAQADVTRLTAQASAVQAARAQLVARVLALRPVRYPHNRATLIAASRSLAALQAQLDTAEQTSQTALQEVGALD
jgi:hypothetical protein